MKKRIKELISKYFGNVQYVVRVISVDLSIREYRFNTIKQVDELVNEVDRETYWMIQKINKIRVFNFKYNKEIMHTPLFCEADGVTEIGTLDDKNYYSFLKKDDSLTNIVRTTNYKMTKLCSKILNYE